MSSCNIDHSLEDVHKKLESQKTFLPEDLYKATQVFLNNEQDQQTLNEVFHLLKKYDLVSEEEKMERNRTLTNLVNL